MIKITANEFLELEDKGQNLFIFTMKSECGLCEKALKEFTNFDGYVENFPKIVNIDCQNDNELDALDLTLVPLFRFYKDNKIAWQKAGVLYETQIYDMLKEYRKIYFNDLQ